MDDLLKLIQILERKLQFEQTDWKLIETKLSVDQRDLLHLFLKDRHITDIDAARLYNKSSPQNANYRSSKRKIKEILLNAINDYNPSIYHTSNFARVYFKCNKLHHSVRTLTAMSYLHLAKPIAEPLLVSARKHQFTDIIVDTAQFLSRYYYTEDLNLKKADAYAKVAKDAIQIRLAEVEIEQVYNQFIAKFSKKKSISPEILDEFTVKIQKYNSYHTHKIPSFVFYLNFYLVQLNIAKASDDYVSLLRYAKRGYDYFCNQVYDHKMAKSIFINHISFAYLKMNQVVAARKYVYDSLKYAEVGRPNWFNIMYNLIQIDIAQKQYQEAYDIYQEMIANQNFEDQPTERREVFRLYGIYLEYLCLINVVDAEQRPTRYQINKITQHVPEFARDQKGMKIPIIICQLLFHIHDKNYDAIVDKIDSLKSYCSRHLVRKSPYYRSHCFIKMLLLIPINLFNPVAVRRKGGKFLNRLTLVPHTVMPKQSQEIEIIPYEDLWEFILKYLEKPKRISERIKAYRYES